MSTGNTTGVTTVNPATDRQLIAANIRLARYLAGISQGDLADQVGPKVTYREVSRWEHARRVPSLQTMGAIAGALGRSRGWFYDEH